MENINLAKNATNALAAALVNFRANGGRVDNFVESKLRLAINVSRSNAGGDLPEKADLELPADFKGAQPVIDAVVAIAWRLAVIGDTPLPKKAVERAEEARKSFQKSLPARAKARAAAMMKDTRRR